MTSSLPPPELRAAITEKLSELIAALEAHPAWIPPNPHRGLFHVWDFVSRSRYIMTELDHIRDGEPVQHPEQIPRQKKGRTGPEAAAESFSDVCGRSVAVNEMVSNPRLLTMMGLPQVDYGSGIVAKAQAVVDAIGQGH
ncbi:uncharacterized protein LY79DRAFT_668061 [Colletotrichum navitas]|uniref:Uncharacterized protein n=1 Tax=Colletotrichum navitas TaxID=681940 RepID=A0AAD8Q3I3_9PEZI|nr:uncharacterized protein LY79DRAFT_668061 [Colletotrichum navitas]KAK1595261.1 hypothetical protein LY79DRAFT_668061 [Colletotrichum navitas]